jgi:hypothetical protein
MTASHDSGRPVAGAPYPLDAGITLTAAEALAGQELWTRDQVAYVVAAAYWSGAGVIGRHDAAELAEFAYAATLGHDWLTPEQRVRQRIEIMERADEFVKLRRKPAWPVLRPGPITGVDENGYVVTLGVCDPDCEWPEVAVPGGGL